MAAKTPKKNKIFSLLTPTPLWGLIVAVGFFVTLLAEWLLPLRVYIGAAFICLIVSVVVVILSIKEPTLRLPTQIIFFLGIFSLLGIIYKGFVYSFVHEPFLPFWEISLVLGVALAVFVMMKWCRKGTKAGGRIGGILAFSFLFFCLIMILICHANFLLDFHEPTEQVARIEEKDTDYNRNGPDTYKFKVVTGGESFYLEVSLLEYEQYEVGDTYTFRQYEGAFGTPFYIAD